MVVLQSFVNILINLIVVFVACELGQRTSDAFNKIENEFKQFNWYLFPGKIKQILPLVMIMTQQPVVIKCFGSISCSRETFKKGNFDNLINSIFERT